MSTISDDSEDSNVDENKDEDIEETPIPSLVGKIRLKNDLFFQPTTHDEDNLGGEDVFKISATNTPTLPDGSEKIMIVDPNVLIPSTTTSNRTKASPQQPLEEREWPHPDSPIGFESYELSPTPSTSHLHDRDNVGENSFNATAPGMEIPAQPNDFGKIRIIDPNTLIPSSSPNSSNTKTSPQQPEESEWPNPDSPIGFESYELSPTPSTSHIHDTDNVTEISFNVPATVTETPAQPNDFGKIRIIDPQRLIQSETSDNNTKTSPEQPLEESVWPHRDSPSGFESYELSSTQSTSRLDRHDSDKVGVGENPFKVPAPARGTSGNFGKIRIIDPHRLIQSASNDNDTKTSPQQPLEESVWPHRDSPTGLESYELSSTSRLDRHDRDNVGAGDGENPFKVPAPANDTNGDFEKIRIIDPSIQMGSQVSGSHIKRSQQRLLEESDWPHHEPPMCFGRYEFSPSPSTSQPQLHVRDNVGVGENPFKVPCPATGIPIQSGAFKKIRIVDPNTLIQSNPNENNTETAQQRPLEESEWSRDGSPSCFGRYDITPTPSTSQFHPHERDNVGVGENSFKAAAEAVDTQYDGFGRIRIMDPNRLISAPSDHNTETAQQWPLEESGWSHHDSSAGFRSCDFSPTPSTSQMQPQPYDGENVGFRENSFKVPAPPVYPSTQPDGSGNIRIIDTHTMPSTSNENSTETVQPQPSEEREWSRNDAPTPLSNFELHPAPSTRRNRRRAADQPAMAPFGDYCVVTDEPVNDAMFMRGTLETYAAHANFIEHYNFNDEVAALVHKISLSQSTGNTSEVRKLALSLDAQATIFGIAGEDVFKILSDGSVKRFQYGWGELSSIDIPDDVFLMVGTSRGCIVAIEQETMRVEFYLAVSAEPVTTVRNYGLHSFALTENSAMAANTVEEILEYGTSHVSSMHCGVLYGEHFIVGTAEGKLLRLTLPTLGLYEANEISPGVAVTSMATLGDSLLVIGFEDGYIKIFATFPTYEVAVVGFAGSEVFHLEVSFDQKWVLSCDGRGLKLFRLQNVQEHKEAARKFQQSTYANIPVKQEPVDDAYGFLNIKQEPEDTYDYEN